MKKFFQFFINLFAVIKLNVLHFMEEFAQPAVDLVAKIKALVDGAGADAFAALLKLDPKILAAIRAAFPDIMEYLNKLIDTKPCFEGDGTPEEIIQCVIDHLKEVDPALRNQALKYIAARVTVNLAGDSGKEISESKVNWLVESALLKYKHPDVSSEGDESDEKQG